jgi:hypothetical protein
LLALDLALHFRQADDFRTFGYSHSRSPAAFQIALPIEARTATAYDIINTFIDTPPYWENFETFSLLQPYNR